MMVAIQFRFTLTSAFVILALCLTPFFFAYSKEKHQSRAVWDESQCVKCCGLVCLFLVFAQAISIAHYTSLCEVWATVPLDRGKDLCKIFGMRLAVNTVAVTLEKLGGLRYTSCSTRRTYHVTTYAHRNFAYHTSLFGCQ